MRPRHLFFIVVCLFRDGLYETVTGCGLRSCLCLSKVGIIAAVVGLHAVWVVEQPFHGGYISDIYLLTQQRKRCRQEVATEWS